MNKQTAKLTNIGSFSRYHLLVHAKRTYKKRTQTMQTYKYLINTGKPQLGLIVKVYGPAKKREI